jgi:serine/threonine protein kinase/Flp pilus assembly protein TadD
MNDVKSNAKAIFLQALEFQTPEELDRFLDDACCGNADLRARAEELLQAHKDAGNFLGGPRSLDATLDEPVAEGPGTVIGPYKLMEQIGEGGMGLVFVAEQQQPVRRKVALKVIKPGMDTRQIVARFEAERQALAMMDHPNIAKVLDGGETAGGRPYFVMELVKGVPITDYCDQNQVSIRQRLELFVSVCQAVQHAHQKGIIHRDLKPSNVLVMSHDGTPVVKVIDFGVAKAMDKRLTDKTIYTQLSQMVGTPLYMSPEQAGQSGLDVDTRSDIYSLGVLLYELLTGTTPFDREHLREASYDEIRRVIREEEPPRPSTRISTLGKAATTISTQRQSEPKRLSQLIRGELDWIVMKALEKDRSRRYETANDLARDIQRYLADEPVQACPPSAWYRFRKFARRKRTTLVTGVCVFLALAGMTGGAGWAVRDRGAREEALDKAVEAVLAETETLIQQGRWPEALAVVDRAEQLLAAAGRIERPKRLHDLRKDLVMAERLEEIYHQSNQNLPMERPAAVLEGATPRHQQQRNSSEEDFFSGREQDRRFSEAFRDFGIDVEALDTVEAAARMRATKVDPALVQALDEWAAMRKRSGGEQDGLWKKLLAIAQQADADEWRNRFREALLCQDRVALMKLADELPIREVPPATVYLLGHALNSLGALDKAMTVVREGHRHHPEDFWLNDALGYFCKDCCRPPRYDDALRYYSATVALRPRNRLTRWSVALVLEKKGALEEALEEYTKIIELYPKCAAAHIKLGSALYHKNQWDEAIREFRTVIELDPNNVPAHNNLGFILRKKNQWDEAIREFRTAIELDPNNVMPHNNLGYVLLDKHQWDEAVREYRTVIELDPKNGEAHLYLGNALYNKKQRDEAIREFRTAIELDPKNFLAHNNLGVALSMKNEWDEAIREFRTAIEFDPKYTWAHNYLAWLLATCPVLNLRDPQRAVELAKRAVELAPTDGNYWNTLGVAYYRNGQWKATIQALKKSMDLRKGGTSADFFFLAMAHWQLGEKEQARQWYDRAMRWMEKNQSKNDELHRFRSEAAELLGIEKVSK